MWEGRPPTHTRDNCVYIPVWRVCLQGFNPVHPVHPARFGAYPCQPSYPLGVFGREEGAYTSAWPQRDVYTAEVMPGVWPQALDGRFPGSWDSHGLWADDLMPQYGYGGHHWVNHGAGHPYGAYYGHLSQQHPNTPLEEPWAGLPPPPLTQAVPHHMPDTYVLPLAPRSRAYPGVGGAAAREVGQLGPIWASPAPASVPYPGPVGDVTPPATSDGYVTTTDSTSLSVPPTEPSVHQSAPHSRRQTYVCKLCGQPKRGHHCPVRYVQPGETHRGKA